MGMQDDIGEAFVVERHGGAQVVSLSAPALAKDQWRAVRLRIRRLLFESTQGLVVDCRSLPAGSSVLVTPLLYELLLAGRQKHPRIEVAAVGDLQS